MATRQGAVQAATLGLIAAMVATGGTAQQRTPAAPPENPRAAAALLAAAPKTVIANGLLRATILLPDASKGFYRGTRFDWSGMIASLTLKGTEFYGLWFGQIADNVRDYIPYEGTIVAGPNTAAIGPAEAFDSQTPPGWAQAAPGEGFLKVGVGILRKPADGAAYSPFRTYDLIDGGHWKISRARTSVRFTQTVQDAASGFAYSYSKTIVLLPDRPEMRIEHALTNRGARPLTTTMFNHNFFTAGGTDAQAGMLVQTSFPIMTTRPPAADAATIDGTTIRYGHALGVGEVVSVPISGFDDSSAQNSFSVTTRSGAGYSVSANLPLQRLQLWSISSILAMEPHVGFTIAPGQTRQWASTYRYTAAR